MNKNDARERFLAANKLLLSDATTLEKFESIQKLARGFNPRVDRALESCSKAISAIEKLQKGEVIELAAENLPEDTEKEKRRKKAILFFIKAWKQLQGEVERVKKELEAQGEGGKSLEDQVYSFGKIAALAKGPFGIVTILAVLIVAGLIFMNRNKSQSQSPIATPSGVSTPLVILLRQPNPLPLRLPLPPVPQILR